MVDRSATPEAGRGSDQTPRALRLSVTDRCDLRCRYCLPAGRVPFLARWALASNADLFDAVGWLAASFGVDRVKLTGGEPLLRPGIGALVRGIAAIRGVREVSMTSNGTRLARLAQPLADAGLARVNVSLDTLEPERYAALTRGGDLRRALAGIEAARGAGLAVKLNAVLRRSAWRDDVPQLLDFAGERGLEVRLIELMRTGTELAWVSEEHVAAAEVRRWLEGQGCLAPLPSPYAAPAERTALRWRGHEVALGWITPVSHPFCAACDRLRLDARGRLRRCLMDPLAIPLLDLLRDRERATAFARVAAYLGEKHAPLQMDSAAPMRAIGG